MSFLTGVKEGAHLFGERVGIIVNSALLLVTYVIGVGIPAIVGRRKRFLDTGKRGSYWTPLRYENEKEDCYKQF